MRLGIAIVLQAAALISFLIWGFTAMFAPMLFAGEDNNRTWIIFSLFLAMPVTMIIASIAVWIGFAKKSDLIMTLSAVFIGLSYLIILLSSAG